MRRQLTEAQKKSRRDYYARHKEELKKKRRIYYQKVGRFRVQDFYKRHPIRWKRMTKKYRIKRRMEMIQAYGGKCVCCGETTYEFLSMDHKNGKGGEHRKEFGYLCGNAIPNWLRKRNWPKKNFQLLCMNCNWAIGKYGYCPHQKRKKCKSHFGS